MRITEALLRRIIRESLVVEAKNETVAGIQRALNAKSGAKLSDDGKWGDKTDAAWESFVDTFYNPGSGQPTKEKIKQSWKTYGPKLGYAGTPAGVLEFINKISSTSSGSGSSPTSRPAAAAEEAQSAPATNQAPADPRTTDHRELERKPFNEEYLMRIGDQYYSDLIKKHPAIKPGLDEIQAAFDRAKTRRLYYLKTEFPERLKNLQKHLGDEEQIDAEKLKQTMIDRVKDTELFLGKYAEEIKPTTSSGDYIPWNDVKSGWLMLLKGMGKSFSVAAFAPARAACVISVPPDLVIDESGAVSRVKVAPDIEKIYEHEIIHQEDFAADILVGGLDAVKSGAEKSKAAALATSLVSDAMLPADQLTGQAIIDRMRGSPSLAKEINLVAEAYFEPDAIKQQNAKDVIAVDVVGRYAKLLNPKIDDYSITYYFISSLFPPGTDLSDPEPNSLFSLRQSPGATSAQKRSRDLAGASHVRITLSLMRPHLERALREAKETNSIIEQTLRSMATVGEEEVNRAAFVLAITDPTKLQDLTLVAARDEDQSAESEKQAMAESVFRRWHRLAGLLKD